MFTESGEFRGRPGKASRGYTTTNTGKNIIFFVPDEMRASSAYDGEVPMPNLDRLAADGVRFAQCHTSHTVCSQVRVCTYSRARGG